MLWNSGPVGARGWESVDKGWQVLAKIGKGVGGGLDQPYMMVSVVNELLPGGWLEFLTACRLKKEERFDAVRWCTLLMTSYMLTPR